MLGWLKEWGYQLSCHVLATMEGQLENLPQVLLNLNLPSDLLLHLSLNDFLFVQALQRHDEMRSSFRSCQVDSSEFALSQRSADSKSRQ